MATVDKRPAYIESGTLIRIIITFLLYSKCGVGQTYFNIRMYERSLSNYFIQTFISCFIIIIFRWYPLLCFIQIYKYKDFCLYAKPSR